MRYGSLGQGAVIIVNTKAQTEMDELGVDRSFEKKVLLDSMTIEASAYDDYNLFTSEYLEPFEKIRNRKKILAIHEKQKEKYRIQSLLLFRYLSIFFIQMGARGEPFII